MKSLIQWLKKWLLTIENICDWESFRVALITAVFCLTAFVCNLRRWHLLYCWCFIIINYSLPQAILMTAGRFSPIDQWYNGVQEAMKLGEISKSFLAFGNPNCNKIEILLWDKTGFCLLYIWPEKDKFKGPRKSLAA